MPRSVSRVLPRFACRRELLARPIECGRQIFALLVQDLTSLTRGFGRAVPAFARTLTEILTRFLTACRRKQQRDRCAGDRTGNERDEHACPVSFLCHFRSSLSTRDPG